MSWIIEKTGPGPKDNRVEFFAFKGACLALATVGGVYEWRSQDDAAAALVVYRAQLTHEALSDAGQKELF